MWQNTQSEKKIKINGCNGRDTFENLVRFSSNIRARTACSEGHERGGNGAAKNDNLMGIVQPMLLQLFNKHIKWAFMVEKSDRRKYKY